MSGLGTVLAMRWLGFFVLAVGLLLVMLIGAVMPSRQVYVLELTRLVVPSADPPRHKRRRE
ncbi:hypothetical protein CLV30_12869 [Haloactinopolyspora alba]|uniref:Uncharacterized protein n=1 Tax=Haloactinopolyspora alba TaxID=648780 RepID=A0A2P8DF44_9ACTN|nr:hypothetical protein [Haloactinopolyspora alba]PSK95817.1 hypothetical protein CLV30_12869 [Haloactinopolyspora alba]